MQLPKFLLIFAVVCILALVAAEELLDLLPVLTLELLQGNLLLLLKLVLRLAERAQLVLKGAPHLLHLPRHGDHALRVLPRDKGTVFIGSQAAYIINILKRPEAWRRWVDLGELNPSDLLGKEENTAFLCQKSKSKKKIENHPSIFIIRSLLSPG